MTMGYHHDLVDRSTVSIFLRIGQPICMEYLLANNAVYE